MELDLNHLEPGSVFYYFSEISKIPRGSYHIDEISDYLVGFGKQKGLEVHQDGEKNVILIKEASPGCEKLPPLMLQGHMDMVAVKEPGCDRDMEKDPLQLFVDGDLLGAYQTSLGGDDGVALAICLALLSDESLKHPRLELVFTTNEETGMEGAKALDLSPCKAMRMINLDSEDEGIFLAGCASGVHLEGALQVNRETRTGIRASVRISGLHGGHSGQEIGGGYANALILAGRFCRHAFLEKGIRLIGFSGGEADNVIPREAKAEFLLENWNGAALNKLAESCEEKWKNEWGVREEGLTIRVETENTRPIHEEVLTAESMEALTAMLIALPNGVMAYSPDVPDLVETSLNLGKAALSENEFSFVSLIRSAKDAARDELAMSVEALVKLAGGSVSRASSYPGWQFNRTSPLRDELCALYEGISGKPARVEVIHAGLECGLFIEKRPELDSVSIGPDMSGIHTTEERLSISSTMRIYELMKQFIQVQTL